jgi:hypothetical protein
LHGFLADLSHLVSHCEAYGSYSVNEAASLIGIALVKQRALDLVESFISVLPSSREELSSNHVAEGVDDGLSLGKDLTLKRVRLISLIILTLILLVLLRRIALRFLVQSRDHLIIYVDRLLRLLLALGDMMLLL